MCCRFLFMTYLFFSFVLNGQAKVDDEATANKATAMRPMQHNARDLSHEDVIRDIWAMADKYRRNPIITWWYHIGSLVNNGADDVINLHHLAGNIQHIISVLISDNYYQHIRRCEWSLHLREVDLLWGRDSRVITLRADDGDVGNRMVWDYHFLSDYKSPDNLVTGRNCVTDLWSAVDIMREFDILWQSNASVPDALHKRLSSLESDLFSYRTQRKLSFKNIYARNKGKCGIDDNVPNSISFDERSFLSQKFARGDVPFYRFATQ